MRPRHREAARQRRDRDRHRPLRRQTWAWAQVNWAHHFDNAGANITGHLIGLFTITVPGDEIDRDYVEATLGMRAPLNETAAISASATAIASANTPASFLGRVIVSQRF